MTQRIYSKQSPERLLHIVQRGYDIDDGRVDLVGEDEFIQVAALKFNDGQSFRPHCHIYKKSDSPISIAQESWVVITGAVEVLFYDLDNQFLESVALQQGDASITLYGGHAYRILEANTRVFEFKTGPYLGQVRDKVFIDEPT